MGRLGYFLLLMISIPISCLAQDTPRFNPRAITIAVDNTPLSFNPFSKKHILSQQYKHLFFDPLFRWSKDHQLEPRLISHWKRINSTTVRFTLKQDIRFHSGNILTANDVIWSFAQAKKESNNNTTFFKKVSAIKRINKSSFEISSQLSDFQLLDFMTYMFVLDARFYKKNKALLSNSPSILLYPIKSLPASGTGPYLVNDYNPVLGMEVIANSQYWDGEPHFTYLRFMQVKNAQSRLFALLADDVQISNGIPNKNINDIIESNTKGLVSVPSTNAVFLTMNDKVSPVLGEQKVRKAIHLAINQQGMLKHILNGTGRINTSFLSLAETRFLVKQDMPEQAIPKFDLKAAKQRLKNVKFPQSMTLLVMLEGSQNTDHVATALTHMLKKIGIYLITKKTTSKEEWDKTHSFYDFTLSAWHTRLMSRDNVYEELFLNSYLTGYLEERFKESNIKNDIKLRSEYFEVLQQGDWIVPLFFQDKVWAKYTSLNLEDTFSTNGIPYWSLLKIEPASSVK